MRDRSFRRYFRLLAFLLLPLLVPLAFHRSAYAADHAAVERRFQAWLADDLWPDAKKLGISEATFKAAFKGVSLNWKLPDLVPPGEKPQVPKVQHQAEFGSPGAYFAEGAIGPVVAGGRDRLDRYGRVLAAVEKRYGVPGPIVLAIWGRETGFGSASLRYDAFEVLGTKAFMALRKDLFRKELLAALEIVQKGYIDIGAMKSSWAGALGQPQFMPSSYLEHAVDFDGDGRRDIWGSVSDTLASIAHYLEQYHWERGRGWGYEVKVPASVPCSLEGPGRERTVAEWTAMGIRRVGGEARPSSSRRISTSSRSTTTATFTRSSSVTRPTAWRAARRISPPPGARSGVSIARMSPTCSARWRRKATTSGAPTASRASRRAARSANGRRGSAARRPVSPMLNS
jgi:lytic murein transglycosylase